MNWLGKILTVVSIVLSVSNGIDPSLLSEKVVWPDDFSCLGSEAKTIKFANNPSKTVPHGAESYLPQVRLMIGSYHTQHLLQYIPFMFLREKLGVNVTFAPTIDPKMGWDAIEDGYPDLFWQWLADDVTDLLFEFWPLQAAAVADGAGPNEYYQSGSVDFGGFTGTFGEIGFWIPKYVVDQYPEIIVPAKFIDDQLPFKDIIFQGSQNGTAAGNNTGAVFSKYAISNDTAFDGNYTRYFTELYQYRVNATNGTRGVNGMGEKRLVIGTTKNETYIYYDDPSNGKPTIWGTVASYSQSRTANNLTIKLLNGTYNFACMEGEFESAQVFADLYKRRQAFVANIYTPDVNFGHRDPFATDPNDDLQKWEKIAFPRNPDQSIDDPCFLAGECQYPVDPLMKIANPRLKERFPEVYQFFQTFKIGSSALNKLTSYYLDLEGIEMHESERWLNASCQWLKNEEETWNNLDWMIDIKRYDCLHGCGLTGENGITRGGSCNYLTGQCECSHEELEFSSTCNDSCPGLLFIEEGFQDYEHDTNETTTSYFKFCGGHGTCQTTKLCECEKGYGDSTDPQQNGCTKPYQKYSFDIGLAAAFISFSSILCVCAIGCIVWLRKNAHYKTVKALSVDMTTLMTLGLVMIAASNIALVTPVTSSSCIAWQWLFGLGGILSIMSPLLKAYRVSRVFHGGKMLRAVKITDKMLMQMLIKAAIIEILICSAYTFSHQFFGGTMTYYNDSQLRVEKKCNEQESQITNYFFLGSLAYFSIMLCALTYYSYGTRRALSVFQESTCAYMSSFLSLFCALISFVFSLATDDPMFRASVQAAAIVIVVCAVLVLFFGVRMFKFYKEPENRNVTDMRIGATTGTSSYISKGPDNDNFGKPGPTEA